MNLNYNNPEYSQKPCLYDIYNGFIRGNMFEDTYDPYKIDYLEIMPNNEQDALMLYIDAYSFAMHDLNLYLDIYPNDKEIYDLFKQINEENKKLIDEYEKKYEPINVGSSKYPFNWSDTNV